ncbi:major capsid protein [Apis mellifera associated microvirus 44]|nr:major capsid protein [Apis mellifera associated microvirus 44]
MKRSKFNLSHYKLFSFDMGHLVPIGLQEVLPGDTFQMSTSALIRCSPLVAPIMHPVHVRIHHWFVPHRLVWDNWEDFITGGPDGNNTDTLPTRSFPTGPAIGTLSDYLGVPAGVNNIEVSALPYRGYAMIWNEFYRDQDLQAPLDIDTGDGPDTLTNITLQNCAWEKDYFTSARPWEQKGPSITIPIGTEAPITGIGVLNSAIDPFSNTAQTVRETGGAAVVYPADQNRPTSAANIFYVKGTGINGDPDINADLTGVSTVTINVLREAFALQRFAEARARFGSRYVEYLRYLGVRSSDARLQRPEYLGGGRQTIQFSEVLSTADTTNVPVGGMKGHGLGAMRSNRFRRFFEEHGYIFSLMSVKPRTVYTQGIPRHWNRRNREDFWQKELQHIGQQEILKKEIYYAADGSGNDTWGYQDRYDEYRRGYSQVSGDFRTSNLNYWHMARIFTSAPALNAAFVQADPTNRIFASSTLDTMYAMCNHSVVARRMVAGKGSSFIY